MSTLTATRAKDAIKAYYETEEEKKRRKKEKDKADKLADEIDINDWSTLPAQSAHGVN